jgi:RNA recognition motif-containing protein
MRLSFIWIDLKDKGTSNHKKNIDNDKKKDETAKKEKKPGVIYLSSIPKKMNVKIIREYFSRFGKVDRIYLEPRGLLQLFFSYFYV